MSKAILKHETILLLLLWAISALYGLQCKSNIPQPVKRAISQLPDSNIVQIGDYVVEVFEDSKGNLWLGTLSKGVAKYDGQSLTYFTTEDGIAGNAVVQIVEDADGNLWLGTHSGLSKYDGNTFKSYTQADGLCHDRVSFLFIDRSQTLWIGTWGGVCRWGENGLEEFPLPVPEVEILPYQSTMEWVTDIMEDDAGHLWFARDGYGACKYDGHLFTHISKKDGLPSNNVHGIAQDLEGNFWFATRMVERDNPDPEKRSGEGGLSKYDGSKMTHFPKIKGLNRTDVYSVYRDRSGSLWVSTLEHGVYKYDGTSFSNYNVDTLQNTNYAGVRLFGVMSILEDQEGKMWFGSASGLFRLEPAVGIINITQRGPWE